MEGKSTATGARKPAESCMDRNCPFHGTLKVRGRAFTGTVVSDRMTRTVSVEWTSPFYLQKYERYEKRRSNVKVHNPPCIGAMEGEAVKIMECRPLSKTKNFVVIEKLGMRKGFKERAEALEEAKVKKEKRKAEEKVEEKLNIKGTVKAEGEDAGR